MKAFICGMLLAGFRVSDQINISLMPELQRSGFVGNFDGVYQRLGYVTLSIDGVLASSALITFTCAGAPFNC